MANAGEGPPASEAVGVDARDAGAVRYPYRLFQWNLFLCNWELGALAVSIPVLTSSEQEYFSGHGDDGLRLRAEGYGAINMAYFFAAVASYFVVSGYLLGTVPPRTLCAAACLVGTAGTVLCAFAFEAFAFLLGRLLMGMGASVPLVYAFVWVGEFAPRDSVVAWGHWLMAVPLHTASATGSLVGATAAALKISWRWTLLLQAVQWATVGVLLRRLPRNVVEVPHLRIGKKKPARRFREAGATGTEARGARADDAVERRSREQTDVPDLAKPLRVSAAPPERNGADAGPESSVELVAQTISDDRCAAYKYEDGKMMRICGRTEESRSNAVMTASDAGRGNKEAEEETGTPIDTSMAASAAIVKTLLYVADFRQALLLTCTCFFTIGVWQTWSFVFLQELFHPLLLFPTSAPETSYQVIAIYFFLLILTASVGGGQIGSRFFGRALSGRFDLTTRAGKARCLQLLRRFSFLLLLLGATNACLAKTFLDNTSRDVHLASTSKRTIAPASTTSEGEQQQTASPTPPTSVEDGEVARLRVDQHWDVRSANIVVGVFAAVFVAYMLLWFFLFAILRSYGVLGLPIRDEDKRIAEGAFAVATDVFYGLGSFFGGVCVSHLNPGDPRSSITHLFAWVVFVGAPTCFLGLLLLFRVQL